ncbi:transcriptional regulator PpsR [Jiella sonneratiae]|uniref:Transcriptional regulator PpsR n=1 Tax=Jiella sonneratiae TaxID=2816856 RepID=A0ABS3J8G4_9HYPH|nr:transcriptional regulator PpsR [Jiella sonneratiae]MBO0905392.1 transcriptional regulator PpsR [Jiella sonneratiae]
MEHPSTGRQFSDPSRSFANLEAAFVATMVTAATDVALLIDRDGTIADVAIREPDLFGEAEKSWIGRAFVDVVTVESRGKVERMLSEQPGEESPARREINHPMPNGPDLPVSYTVLSLTRNGMRLALGRDMRIMATLQQNLVETQLALETDYARLRSTETQYRVLFESAAEPILLVDSSAGRVVEANLSARHRLEREGRRLVGAPYSALFAPQSQAEADTLVAAARRSGETETASLALAGGDRKTPVAARFYRQHGAGRIILRLAGEEGEPKDPIGLDLVARLGQTLPDGIAVIGADRTIVDVNESFLDLTEIASRDQVVGRSLEEILGRRGVELAILIKAIETDGFVRNFSTHINTRYGGVIDVEVSGSTVMRGDERFFGFAIREAARAVVRPAASEPFRSANDMTGLVGRVPLREIIRETADIIEQLCIEAALDLTRNNRASAAEMLGLSRQSLYSKLKRHGITNTYPDPEDTH